MKLLVAFLGVLVLSSSAPAAAAQTRIHGWGSQQFDSTWDDESFVGLKAGASHTLAWRSDGTARIWGDNSWGQSIVPALPAGVGVVDIAGGGGHTVACLSDGTAIAFGGNGAGQC